MNWNSARKIVGPSDKLRQRTHERLGSAARGARVGANWGRPEHEQRTQVGGANGRVALPAGPPRGWGETRNGQYGVRVKVGGGVCEQQPGMRQIARSAWRHRAVRWRHSCSPMVVWSAAPGIQLWFGWCLVPARGARPAPLHVRRRPPLSQAQVQIPKHYPPPHPRV